MAKITGNYACTECGWQTTKWVGRCGECQQWGTVIERSTKTGLQRQLNVSRPDKGNEAKPITAITGDSIAHESTGVAEFDRVLGGGIVPGVVILLSGEPGIGKSTLLLEVAAQYASGGKKVLYLSAEESANQVRMRAERTGAMKDTLYLAAETDLEVLLGQVDQVDPDLLIVDSVQTVFSPAIDGLAGGPSQVLEVATVLSRIAKRRNLPVLLVGHVTKDGSIAGPRLLEHLVDVVCHFEGDKQTGLRFVRSLKNRYGSTDEVGCFEMTGDGIREVSDPSGLFLGDAKGVSGTCRTVTVEGRRAIPVEIQALVAPSSTPQPRRVMNGLDPSRVAMILAVLERRAGIQLANQDIYAATVGGIKITEPGADLAIAIAIASAAVDKPVLEGTAAFGEISLAGEVRRVSNEKQRASEASRMGLNNQISSKSAQIVTAISKAFPNK